LSLALQIVEPAGAVDDTLSYGQAFKLQAIVKNKPDVAGTTGQGLASIDLPEIFTLIDSLGITSDIQKPFSEGIPFFWWIRVSENSSTSIAKTEFLNLLNTKIGATSRATKMEGASNKTIDINKAFELKEAMDSQAEEISVQLDALPLDINSARPAFAINEKEIQTIYLEEKANILVQSTDVPKILSTGQSFDYTIKAELEGNLINPTALIKISPALTTGKNFYQLALGQDSTTTLRLAVPESYNGEGRDTISVMVFGFNANFGGIT